MWNEISLFILFLLFMWHFRVCNFILFFSPVFVTFLCFCLYVLILLFSYVCFVPLFTLGILYFCVWQCFCRANKIIWLIDIYRSNLISPLVKDNYLRRVLLRKSSFSLSLGPWTTSLTWASSRCASSKEGSAPDQRAGGTSSGLADSE